MSNIAPAAQAIIDSMAAHKWQRGGIDRPAIEAAITKHLAELGLQPQPFEWFATAREGYAAAWSAAESAAESAAWSAANSAARSAAQVNALAVFDDSAQAKMVAIWLPMADAFNAGLWMYWITPTVVICVEQPCLYISDNRLHREDGPAVEWPAGEAYYFWRGTPVPAEWITDRSKLDAKTALKWTNIEQRRVACEMLGWHRILGELKARTIDKHADPQIGELVEVNLPDSGRERFLRVQCGTGREFALPVPPTITTAIEAQAWSYGIDPKEFKTPEIRT